MSVKVICLGDSITYGFPFGPGFSWVKLAGDRLPFEFINEGVNGDTLGDMLRRAPSVFRKYHAGAVILLGGTNDAYIGKPTMQAAADMRQLVTMAGNNGLSVFIGMPIPSLEDYIEDKLIQYRQQYRQIAENFGCSTIDFYSAFFGSSSVTPDRKLFHDTVHPSREGYKQMSDIVHAAMFSF